MLPGYAPEPAHAHAAPPSSLRRSPWPALAAAAVAGLILQAAFVVLVTKVWGDDEPVARGRTVAIDGVPAAVHLTHVERWTGGVGDEGQSRLTQTSVRGVVGLGGSMTDLRIAGEDSLAGHVVKIGDVSYVDIERATRGDSPRWARVVGKPERDENEPVPAPVVTIAFVKGARPEAIEARLEAVSSGVRADGSTLAADVDPAKFRDVTGVDVLAGTAWAESGPATVSAMTISVTLDAEKQPSEVRFLLTYSHPDNDEHRRQEVLSLSRFGVGHRVYEPHPAEVVDVASVRMAMAIANGMAPLPGEIREEEPDNPFDWLRGLLG